MSEPAPPQQPRISPIVRNVLSNWSGYFFTIVITFILSPFVVRHLGNSAYGVWVVIVSLTGYLGLFDLGVRGAVTRYVAKFHTQADYEESSRIASSALGIFATGGIVAILVSIGLSLFALDSFRIPEVYRLPARIVLPLMGLTVAVTLVGGVFGGILAGLQRVDLMNAIQVASSGVRALVIVVALRSGKGIITLACIQLAFSLAAGLANALTSLRLFPQLRLRVEYLGRKYLSLIFSFSLYSFLLHVSAYLVLYTDAVVIGIFLPITFVTFFSIAGNLVNYSRDLISGISGTMTPLASKLEAEGKESELRQVMLNVSRYASAVMMPIALTFLLRGSTFIGLWMGPEFATLSGRLLWILALSTMFTASWQVGGAVMFGINKHKGLVPASLVVALANLAISVTLVQRIGVEGVAWGTTVPDLVLCLAFWPLYVRRTLKISPRTYAISTWARPLLSMVPFALITYVIERWWPAPKLLLFFLQVATALPLALVGFWFVCVTPSQRDAYSQQFLERLGKAFGRT